MVDSVVDVDLGEHAWCDDIKRMDKSYRRVAAVDKGQRIVQLGGL